MGFSSTADEGTIAGQDGVSYVPPSSEEPDLKFQRTILRTEPQCVQNSVEDPMILTPFQECLVTELKKKRCLIVGCIRLCAVSFQEYTGKLYCELS